MIVAKPLSWDAMDDDDGKVLAVGEEEERRYRGKGGYQHDEET